MKCSIDVFIFFWLFVVGRKKISGSGRVRGSKFNCATQVGSGRVGSDDLGYGPGSGFTLKPVQTSTRKHKSMCGGDSGSFWRVNEALYVCSILFTFVCLRIKVL